MGRGYGAVRRLGLQQRSDLRRRDSVGVGGGRHAAHVERRRPAIVREADLRQPRRCRSATPCPHPTRAARRAERLPHALQRVRAVQRAADQAARGAQLRRLPARRGRGALRAGWPDPDDRARGRAGRPLGEESAAPGSSQRDGAVDSGSNWGTAVVARGDALGRRRVRPTVIRLAGVAQRRRSVASRVNP